MQNSQFQFSLRGLLGYCTLLAVAMSILRLGYVELHGYLGLSCVGIGFILSGAIIGIPIGLAINGKRGARKGAVFGAILLALFVLISFSTEAVWSGRFNLTVNLRSVTFSPITKIEYMVASREEGNWIDQNPHTSSCLFQQATDFDGKRFTAKIPCSGRRIAIIDYETSYFE